MTCCLTSPSGRRCPFPCRSGGRAVPRSQHCRAGGQINAVADPRPPIRIGTRSSTSVSPPAEQFHATPDERAAAQMWARWRSQWRLGTGRAGHGQLHRPPPPGLAPRLLRRQLRPARPDSSTLRTDEFFRFPSRSAPTVAERRVIAMSLPGGGLRVYSSPPVAARPCPFARTAPGLPSSCATAAAMSRGDRHSPSHR